MIRMGRRRLGAGLAGAGAMAAAGLHAPAAQAFEVGFTGDVGAFVGWTFGGPGSGFAWGLEGRALATNQDYACGDNDLRPYGGGVARISFSDGYRPMLGLGLALGASFADGAGAGAEVGLGYDFGQTPRLALWVGGEAQYSVAALRTQVRVFDGSATVAPTFRFPAIHSDGPCYVIGRPLRSESGVAALPGLHLQGEAPPLDERAARVGAAWCQRARTEWASVPAFQELAAQLTLAEAPASLVQAARRAAMDEARHAVDSARIAARVEGAPVVLHPQVGLHRKLTVGPEARARLAVESYLDGCRQEGAAAACAWVEAQRATAPEVQAIQARIAADEARHAALGWAVVGWLAEDPAARAALEAALEAPPPPVEGDSDKDLEGFGVLSEAERGRITARIQGQARDRLAGLLGA